MQARAQHPSTGPGDGVGLDEQIAGGRWLDVVVSRTLLFVLMTAVIVAVFTVVFVTVGREVFLRNSAVAVLVGAGIAALIQPVYTWGVHAVNLRCQAGSVLGVTGKSSRQR
ncbi:hypothetical protein [Streptomyces sp. NPDC047009]|uniref:hypothetical protein n=1 Tax=Streptomyces sp. NPDC047009 TaxID=3154496 RepID=UPI0033F3E4DC